ncbi:hypothetical protein HYPSUDRAFT_561266 [Hypholoma sublateritium FD-334 SS-4]|uniref:Uncharacterized protein n=1 Tax=Hypholoma sublateritium (strain FD-334 SS-4) TaxID=945553 RepID=A0A0D2P5C6_HYPSF|nr:hypothetical protein HYPSUDRAFT_561266 [Hypholoma sublateritium FD-334 SS-4]
MVTIRRRFILLRGAVGWLVQRNWCGVKFAQRDTNIVNLPFFFFIAHCTALKSFSRPSSTPTIRANCIFLVLTLP